MDDRLLVSRAAAGDIDSFGQLYDIYFSRIYDFSWRMLRDPAEAAAATADTFARAMHELPAAGKALSVRGWLFAIAYDTALPRAEALSPGAARPTHDEAFGTFEAPDPAALADRALAQGDAEYPGLVWDAVATLNPRDYALLDLRHRQELDAGALAGMHELSKTNARTLIQRMNAAAAGAITSYVLARRGAADCPGLQQALAGVQFPPYTDAVRRAVDEHTAQCERCQAARNAMPPPLDVFASLTPVPASFAAKGDIWRGLVEAWPYGNVDAAAVAAIPAAAAPFTAAGFGGGTGGGNLAPAGASPGDNSARNRVLMFAAAAAGMLAVAFAGGALIAATFGGGDDNDDDAPAVEATATAQSSVTPGVIIDTATPNLTPSQTATDEPTATATLPPPTEVPPTEAPPTPVPPTPTNTPAGPPTRTPRPTNTPRNTPTAEVTAEPTVAP